MGLEPMTSCVTGRRSNLAELTHQKSMYMNLTFFVAEIAVPAGFEPAIHHLNWCRSTNRAKEPICKYSGERGIRTPGTFQFYSFQDCRNSPLYHLTKILQKISLYKLRARQGSNLRPIDCFIDTSQIFCNCASTS